MGPVWPQVTAVSNSSRPALTTLIIAILTIFTLLAFQFTRRQSSPAGKRSAWRDLPAQLGRGVLMITFGALFAALFSTSLILLSTRLSYYLNQILP
ncbi:MAG: hypothetical protein P8183_09355, partial [Anaerolineae bacterium]